MADENRVAPLSRQVIMRNAETALPPHPLDKRWYAHVGGQSYGPFTGHEIRVMCENHQIGSADFLCAEGGTTWTQAKNEPLLGSVFRAREDAERSAPKVTAANGGTVVQVTTQSPNLAQAAMLLSAGDASNKSPGIALLLSLLICGVGQMYNGQVGKGIAMLVGFVLLWAVLLGWIVWIWSMVDAYTTAKEMNLRYQQRILAGLM